MTPTHLLSFFVDILATPSKRALRILAAAARCPPEKMALLQIADDSNNEYSTRVYEPRKTLLELLGEFRSVALTFAQVLAMLPSLRPRFYSISSSALRSPGVCHLTVAVTTSKTSTGRVHRGLAR